MIENRLTRRYRIANATCKLASEQRERQVFNISIGGMLMERLNGDKLTVGSRETIKVNIAGHIEAFVAKVVRVQEKSFGMVFPQLNENETDFLYANLKN